MIGERYAPAIPLPRRSPKKSLSSRIPAAPSIAGRERLLSAIGQSFHARLIVVMALVFVAALLYLAQASQVSIQEFSISDLQRQHLQLAGTNANLWAQASSLQSLPRIEGIATTRLNMVGPDLTPIWIRPVIPQVQEGVSVGSDTNGAVVRSSPLSWMRNFVSFVRSQL